MSQKTTIKLFKKTVLPSWWKRDCCPPAVPLKSTFSKPDIVPVSPSPLPTLSGEVVAAALDPAVPAAVEVDAPQSEVQGPCLFGRGLFFVTHHGVCNYVIPLTATL